MAKKNRWNCLRSMVLGLVLLLQLVNPLEIQAAPSTGKSTNLVVLVRFQGDAIGDENTGYNTPYTSQIAGAPSTYWGLLQRRFNGENDKFAIGSFREYLSKVSGGQHKVESVFPQTTQNENVEYITLDGNIADYQGANEISMVAEIAQKLSAKYPNYDGSVLDQNGDGAIDNMMILASVPSSGQFTPHTANAGNGYAFAGKTIGYYNVLETCTSVTSAGTFWDSFDVPTAAHEYVHTFGIPDYYRTTGMSGTPVGMWDLMAGSLGRPALLATTRENIGWTNVPTKAATNATYTLYDMDSAYADGSKQQAYKFYTPFSSSEYFVVEYRQSGNKYTAELDQTNLQADGLLVYRVNPTYAATGNLQGNDYIYVCRPGDTGLTSSAGEIANAQVGMSAYKATRQSVGTKDLTKTIADDAICYSDGQNSGIEIHVVSQDEHSITFDISFPEYEIMNLWESVTSANGTKPFSEVAAKGVQTVVDGQNLYVLATNTNTASVLKYDGKNWTNFGKCMENTASASAMAVCDGKVYVLVSDYQNNQTILKQYVNGRWKTKATTGGYASNSPTLGVVNQQLYTLVAKNEKNPKLQVLQNGSWQDVGTELDVSYVVNPLIFAYNSKPAIACGDFTKKVTSAWVWEQNGWTNLVKDTCGYAKKLNVASASGNVYLLANDSTSSAKLYIIDCNDNTCATKTLSSVGNNLLDLGMTVGQEKIYIASVAADGKVYVYTAALSDVTALSQLGSTVYSPAISLALERMNGKIYCAVTPQTDGAMDVRSYDAIDGENPSQPEPKPEPKPEPTPIPQPETKPISRPYTAYYNGIDYSGVFDPYYYADRYGDLKQVYGYDNAQLLYHFVNYGMNEGRQAKASFDVNSYRLQYGDLRRAYGGNLRAYYMHYIQYGMHEGRKGTGCTILQNGLTVWNGINYAPVYDYNDYIRYNPDVHQVYGNDDQAVLLHFINCGMSEGRRAKTTFDVNSYRLQYSDLRGAYGMNLAAYYMHYIKYGVLEGRKGTGCTMLQGATTIYNGVDYGRVYDYAYYVSNNSDVYQTYGNDDQAILAHFVNYGMSEGRIAKTTFVVKKYKARYKDLQQAYGNQQKQYYLHYINWGYAEGRKGN